MSSLTAVVVTEQTDDTTTTTEVEATVATTDVEVMQNDQGLEAQDASEPTFGQKVEGLCAQIDPELECSGEGCERSRRDGYVGTFLFPPVARMGDILSQLAEEDGGGRQRVEVGVTDISEFARCRSCATQEHNQELDRIVGGILSRQAKKARSEELRVALKDELGFVECTHEDCGCLIYVEEPSRNVLVATFGNQIPRRLYPAFVPSLASLREELERDATVEDLVSRARCAGHADTLAKGSSKWHKASSTLGLMRQELADREWRNNINGLLRGAGAELCSCCGDRAVFPHQDEMVSHEQAVRIFGCEGDVPQQSDLVGYCLPVEWFERQGVVILSERDLFSHMMCKKCAIQSGKEYRSGLEQREAEGDWENVKARDINGPMFFKFTATWNRLERELRGSRGSDQGSSSGLTREQRHQTGGAFGNAANMGSSSYRKDKSEKRSADKEFRDLQKGDETGRTGRSKEQKNGGKKDK